MCVCVFEEYMLSLYNCYRVLSMSDTDSDCMLYLQPCIISVKDVIDTSNTLYIVMEL